MTSDNDHLTPESNTVMAGADDASFAAKVDGLLDQVRHDLATGHQSDGRALLLERLADAQISLPDDRVDELVGRLRTD